MTLIAQIDDAACLGHGDCVHVAPGRVHPRRRCRRAVAARAPKTSSARAARACPAGAIILFDAETGDEVDP